MSSKMGTTNAQTNSEHENKETFNHVDSIEAFYAEKVILLTGATGFLGKALLEKLLRSCARVAMIFILLRPKRGKTMEQRLNQMKENSVFDRLRMENPGAINKIHPVKGDVGLPNLGLSAEDRNMLINRVNVVFHSAATVRFDDPLKVAVNTNAKGTDRVIDLCKDMTNLISLIYVSTAYSNANRYDIEESIYPTKLKPSTVIDMCDSLDDKTLNLLQKQIIEGHPNTYTFTKNLAEQIVWTRGADLPVSIVRPSIVCVTHKEPFPGWLDGPSGLTGLIGGIIRGTARVIKCDTKRTIDMVPVDYVIDTIICASWFRATQQNNSIKIYNCTNNADSISWGSLVQLISKYAVESPSKHLKWYPGLIVGTNTFMYRFITITLHFFPAVIMDFVSRLAGSKPINMKTAKNFDKVVSATQYFSTNEWKFHRNNMHELTKKVKTLKDSSNFNTDMDNLDWNTFVYSYLSGIRKYILNENLEAADTFRKRLIILYWIHRIIQISSIFTLVVIIRRICH
ncbi:putative fatty acyl-CoA reductase CG5065 isoform X2 [Hylaeus anthracinus]|uniref:putative fatty acyl-CoA reductase CG5065 isoform X2 n=1 Tax=Hylaeus anthracinus TaxID=313031 RepID=UPI0023B90162|nr:putative fatty acyl-CoA reductase CG5065 isoform X2 [Hylaeus anthracinus]